MQRRTKKYLEYRIVITPDIRTGSRERCFTALVPMLGIATSADTVDEVFANAKGLIIFHLESLRREGKPLPLEDISGEFITTARVAVPS